MFSWWFTSNGSVNVNCEQRWNEKTSILKLTEDKFTRVVYAGRFVVVRQTEISLAGSPSDIGLSTETGTWASESRDKLSIPS